MIWNKDTPPGVKLLTISTSIRWFGWGLGEAFLPIFLLLFSTSFIEAGILASIYNLIFFIFIPIAGYLADNIKVKYMILFGLALYVFIGLGYFLAGLTGAIIFIILARGLNGISYSFDQVGRESYFMRHIPENKISQMFGQFDFIGNLWWIIAVVIGLILAQIFSIPIHWLLFFIIPTSIISFIIVLHLKERHAIGIPRFSIFKIYLNMSKDLLHLNLKMKTILFTSFISGILSSIIYFFVPISCYLNGDGLVDAALLALIYALPLLFSRHIGKIVDSKREKIYTISFLGLTIILITLIFTQNYYILFVIMFFSGAIFELISLINRNLVNKFSDRTHLGEIDSSLNGIASIGAMIGPIIFGFLLDYLGISKSYLVLTIISVIAFVIILVALRYFKK